MDTRMYVMTHKKMEEIQDSLYIPLHVGKSGKEELGYLGDDTGDNISEKNANYCELTGIYWIWKNVACDIVGICHYRRFFVRDGKILTKEEIETQMQKCDIITTNSFYMVKGNVYTQYCDKHMKKDLDLCREVILEKYSDYIPAFDYVMHTVWVSIGNMWIARKDVYDRYCEWLFDILFEVEKRIDMTGYDDYQKRVIGFLSERLLRVWLLMQSETVAEIEIKQIETSEFQNEEKRAELLYHYAKLKLEPVVQLYRSGRGGALVTPFSCSDDFEGKIPVWFCWWQGESEMPEIIRCCVEALKKNLPSEKMVLRLVTFENCMEYVTFTQEIIRKFNDGRFTKGHLAEILRAELLYRYGGMWVDSCYYVAGRIPKWVLEYSELYTLKFKNEMSQAGIAGDSWSGDFWYAPQKKHKFFQFLMESLWYYWEVEEVQRDDSLFDHMTAIALEEFPEIKGELEKCPYCMENVYGLQKYINKKCTQERIEKLKTESFLYKLNYGVEFKKRNIVGQQTMYGYLCEEQYGN